MRCFLRPGAAALLTVCFLVAPLSCGIRTSLAGPLSVQFRNESPYDDSQVYIGFVGPETLYATNVATGVAMAASQFGSEHWYTLDTLPRGIDLAGFSGRIYVAYGSPWNFTHAGYEPSAVSPNDPNYFKRYDKVELTYHGNAPDVANTTSIDYFSIPIELNVYRGGTTGTLVNSLAASPTDVTLAALRGLTSPGDAAVVRDAGGNFVRVIGPSSYPPPPGLPSSHYDNFDAYLTYARDTYAPAHGGVLATIAGRFHGVGPAPLTPETKPQDYRFTATIDSEKNITLTGSGTEIGTRTLLFKYGDLANPAGVYGANPFYYLDGNLTTALNPLNDVYGWMIGDLLAGFNIGAIGSTALVGGQPVGTLDSQQWFAMMDLFSALQSDQRFYNQWAARLSEVTQAYNFAYTDRFAHVVTPLDPARVDTLEIVLLGDTHVLVPEPATWAMLFIGGTALLAERSLRRRSPQNQKR
ncbi:MAG: PEP-CTERM sorting domain-containing protein [Pirellulales bacterium]|nr:PEP-CTERM sorting domain-containing protein [Pirellulales bacterium]